MQCRLCGLRSNSRFQRTALRATAEPDRYDLWIISESVVASLENFQGKVAQVVEAVSFSFNDFDLVIDPFQKAGMDGVIAVV